MWHLKSVFWRVKWANQESSTSNRMVHHLPSFKLHSSRVIVVALRGAEKGVFPAPGENFVMCLNFLPIAFSFGALRTGTLALNFPVFRSHHSNPSYRFPFSESMLSISAQLSRKKASQRDMTCCPWGNSCVTHFSVFRSFSGTLPQSGWLSVAGWHGLVMWQNV